MGRKFTYEEVREGFTKRGYTLLETEYVNSTTKMKYRCPKHPDKELFIRYNDLKNGRRGCIYCSGHAKPSMSKVIKVFNDLGLDLITKEYVNCSTKMEYRCRKHPDKVRLKTYDKARQGVGCPKCGIDKIKQSISRDKHPNWGGGRTLINDYLRRNLKEWKIKSMEATNYKCDVTGNAGDLEVHHLVPYHKLAKQSLAEAGLSGLNDLSNVTNDELKLLLNIFLNKHNELGIPLLKEVHKEFHNHYGFDTTVNDYIEFKNNYQR